MIDRILRERIADSKRSVLLLGARQVGKTTLIRSLPLARFVNLADESLFISYAKDPARLIREVRAMRKKGIVAIDEIQRVPRLLNSVQVLIDEKTPMRFILTGSSARKLRRGNVNLLPGRIIVEHLTPLAASEVGEDFDIDRALRVGCLPGVYLDEEEGEGILGSYATVYLKEEIQAEALTRDLGSYSRFLDVAAEMSGMWVNYSKLSNDTAIPRETIRRYLSILYDTLLAYHILPYQPKVSHRRVSHRDRVIFFDVGVRNAVLGLHRGMISPNEIGSIFEQFVILQCIYFNEMYEKGWKFFSYRTNAGAEVDLVIDTGKRLIAIECKSGRNVSEADFRGLKSFEEIATKPVKKIVVYRGSERQLFKDRVTAIPCKEFLLHDIKSL